MCDDADCALTPSTLPDNQTTSTNTSAYGTAAARQTGSTRSPAGTFLLLGTYTVIYSFDMTATGSVAKDTDSQRKQKQYQPKKKRFFSRKG